MKTTTHLSLLLTAALAAHTYGGDAKVTLDSVNGTSAFIVRDSASNVLTRVQSDGKVGIGVASPAYRLDVLGDINLTGLFYTNGVAWNPLTSYTENDPLFVASVAYGITGTQVGNWNTAFGWGNHATAGYLTAYTETDPVFGASAAAGIAAADLAAWNAKLGGSGTAGYVPAFSASGTLGNSALFSAASGNVGIGTTTPNDKLEINGSLGIANRNDIFIRNAPNYNGLRWVLRTDATDETGGDVGTSFDFISRHDDGSHWNNVLSLNRNGNVGIGTIAPSLGLLQLTKTSGNDVNLVLEQSGVSTWDIRNMATSGNFGIYNGQLGTVSMAIDKANGKVGIGTTTPAAKLHIAGYDPGVTLLLENTSANPGRNYILFKTRGTEQGYIGLGGGETDHMSITAHGASNNLLLSTGGFIRMTVLPSGNIGIGTTTPDYTLHVNGSVAGTSAYNNLSDSRLKKDVQPIGDALAIVEALRGVTYNWDQTVDPLMKLDDRNHVGFLAQEVEAVLPQAVSTASDARQTKSVAYSEVIPVLVEAIKQQQAQINTLMTENDTLKAQNAIILKRLDALEAK